MCCPLGALRILRIHESVIQWVQKEYGEDLISEAPVETDFDKDIPSIWPARGSIEVCVVPLPAAMPADSSPFSWDMLFVFFQRFLYSALNSLSSRRLR